MYRHHRFASSQHVSEFKKESGDGGAATLCVDGFFNNLNCLAVFLAHTIDSLHRATSDYDEEVRCQQTQTLLYGDFPVV